MAILLSRRTLKRIMERRETYLANRLTVPITEEQYLWWDDVITHHFDEALAQYKRMLRRTGWVPGIRCYTTGLPYVLNFKFRGVNVMGHRFTYAIHCSLPLSQTQIARHQCGNSTCLNAAHIELGDQKQNFLDYLAARAYGIRRDLLPRDPLETLK